MRVESGDGRLHGEQGRGRAFTRPATLLHSTGRGSRWQPRSCRRCLRHCRVFAAHVPGAAALQRLVNVLLERVVPAAMQRRRQALAGRGVASDQQQREQRQRKYVQELVASGAVSAAPPGSAPGLTSVRTSEEHVTTTCVGDLSCSCEFSGAWRWEWAGSGACAWRRRQACAALLAPSFHPAPHPCWHPPGQRTPCART